MNMMDVAEAGDLGQKVIAQHLGVEAFRAALKKNMGGRSDDLPRALENNQGHDYRQDRIDRATIR